MNHRDFVLKSAASFYSRQLLDVHLYPVSTDRQVSDLLFGFRLGQFCFLQDAKHGASMSKAIGAF